MGRLTLIIGLPNAGKTTYSAKYENVIHFDDVRAAGAKRFDAVADAVSKSADICVEGVYSSVKRRKQLCDAFKGRKVCIWLNTPLDECIRRELSGRRRPTKMVEWASERFEPPTYAEGWDKIIIIGD